MAVNIDETSHSLFHSFCVRPDFSFQTQAAGEEVILVLRQHPFVIVGWILRSLFFLALVVIVNFIFAGFGDPGLKVFLNFFAGVLIFSYLWFSLVGYHYNVGIVTNQRILDLDFHLFSYREFSIADLSKVEDITTKATGFFQSLFNYGDVFIQTAGSDANVEFERVPRPADVADIINQLLPK